MNRVPSKGLSLPAQQQLSIISAPSAALPHSQIMPESASLSVFPLCQMNPEPSVALLLPQQVLPIIPVLSAAHASSVIVISDDDDDDVTIVSVRTGAGVFGNGSVNIVDDGGLDPSGSVKSFSGGSAGCLSGTSNLSKSGSSCDGYKSQTYASSDKPDPPSASPFLVCLAVREIKCDHVECRAIIAKTSLYIERV